MMNRTMHQGRSPLLTGTPLPRCPLRQSPDLLGEVIMRVKSTCLLLIGASLMVCSFGAGATDEREAVFNKLQTLLNSSPPEEGARVSVVYIAPGSEVQKTGDMLIGALFNASRSKEPVAIVGPDGALILDVITFATAKCPQGILSGVKVFYLGREGDNKKIDNLRGKCSADVVFGTYP